MTRWKTYWRLALRNLWRCWCTAAKPSSCGKPLLLPATCGAARVFWGSASAFAALKEPMRTSGMFWWVNEELWNTIRENCWNELFIYTAYFCKGGVAFDENSTFALNSFWLTTCGQLAVVQHGCVPVKQTGRSSCKKCAPWLVFHLFCRRWSQILQQH